ncbi:MAG: hypothetical protein ACE5E9_12895 [Nitrospinaceae bacterium]
MSRISRTGLILCGTFFAASVFAQDVSEKELPAGEGRQLVEETCTACHSARIILQNRMTRKRWDETLTWMQEKQGLPELKPGVRKQILDYLAKHQGMEGKSGPARKGMYDYDYPPNPL